MLTASDVRRARRIGRSIRQTWPVIDRDDLESVASEALVIAARDYQERYGDWRPYLGRRVRWACLEAVKQAGRRFGYDQRLGYDRVHEILYSAPPTPFEERITDLITARKMVGLALLVLEPRELAVVRGFFYQERTLAAIGRDLGITESRVSQIKSEALMRMRRAL